MTNKDDLNAILLCLAQLKKPSSIGMIKRQLDTDVHQKTLQRRLKKLTENGDVIAQGDKKSRTYRLLKYDVFDDSIPKDSGDDSINKYTRPPVFSYDSLAKLAYLETPLARRRKTNYQRTFVDEYVPNETQYIPHTVRTRLEKMGKRFEKPVAPGTYVKQITQRLLIDLCFSSSQLEGNSYSLDETRSLINYSQQAEGKTNSESVMIMNHKEAFNFVIQSTLNAPLNTFTLKNIHYLLSQDLLTSTYSSGKEREIEVSLNKTTYTPLGNPHQIKKYLLLVLSKAEQIINPFEKSFFLLMHLSYLHAFEGVNAPMARLVCNAPLIQHNMCPLSFVDVLQNDYQKAMLYFYEINELLPALELYEWAYVKSCEQYNTLNSTFVDIDPYRIKYRAMRKDAMGKAIRNLVNDKRLYAFFKNYCQQNNIEQPDKFITMAIADLGQLHEGAIIDLGITEAMFQKYKAL